MRSTLCAFALLAFACDNSSGIYDPKVHDKDFQPQIVSATGPTGGGVQCHPADTGGNCPLPIQVTFRLKQGEFIAKAIVSFQGDGSDTGIERYYAIPFTYGEGNAPDSPVVTLDIEAAIPTTILRQNALFTYTVRLVTGNGAASEASTLTVSVT